MRLGLLAAFFPGPRPRDRRTRPRKNGVLPPLVLTGGRRLPRPGTDRPGPPPPDPQRVPVGHATEIIAAMEPARAAAVLSELPPSAAAAVLGALPRDVADAVRQAMEPAALSLCSDLLHALEAVLDPSGRMVSAVQRPGATSGSDRCVARAAA